MLARGTHFLERVEVRTGKDIEKHISKGYSQPRRVDFGTV